jgi:RNA polymerase sigma factor (sigma-70 family)
MQTAVHRLVHRLRIQSLGSLSDRHLIDAFAKAGDESAFTELVRRHGSLVLGVCRRILGNVQDSEDAFQAVFLVLAKKASAISWSDSIKNWLHGVACRVAMKARGQVLRRKQKEYEAGQQPAATGQASACTELRAVLDEELEQLPDKYRSVLILCYLEGKTRDEAAEQLGWSMGSVKGCLERGREQLRDRLTRRGLALSAILAVALLGEATASAVTPSLAASTVQAGVHFAAGSALAGTSSTVFTLAQGALNAMMIAKIKTIGLVTMTVVAIGVCVAASIYYAASTPVGAATTDGGLAPAVEPVALQEGDGKKKNADEFLGLIKEVDLKVGTIKVQPLHDGDREDLTFSLAGKDLKVVSTLGQELKMADLAVGLRVHLLLKDKDITAIRVENPTLPGVITSIDAEKRTLEARADRRIATYAVAQDAKFTINGQAVRLGQLPLEQRVFLTLSFDKKTVLAVNGNKIVPGGVERLKEGRPVELPPVERIGTQGAVIDIDANKNTLTVLTGKAEDLKIQTIAVGRGLKVKVMFDERPVKEISLAQLTKPVQVTFQLDEDKKNAVSVSVTAPQVRGTIKSIDATAKKITIVEGRSDLAFDVDADVVVRLGERRESKLADVTPGMNVIIGLSLDRQRVLGIVSVGPVRRDGDR